MRTIGNRVLARRHQPTQINGIHLPASALDYYNTGGPKEFIVEQVGTGYYTRKGVKVPIDWCVPGDRILCHSYDKAPVESGLHPDYFFITPDQILAIIPLQLPPKTQI